MSGNTAVISRYFEWRTFTILCISEVDSSTLQSEPMVAARPAAEPRTWRHAGRSPITLPRPLEM